MSAGLSTFSLAKPLSVRNPSKSTEFKIKDCSDLTFASYIIECFALHHCPKNVDWWWEASCRWFAKTSKKPLTTMASNM